MKRQRNAVSFMDLFGALFDVALAEGVAFIPGPAFSPAGHFYDALRLCFASTAPERTEEGIARLRRAIDRLSMRSDGSSE